MVTYFVGLDEVRAYLTDFLHRLIIGKKTPSVWCPLTGSGAALLMPLLDIIEANPEFARFTGATVLPIKVDSDSHRLEVEDGAREKIKGKSVLLFDGAIHSGSTMHKALIALSDLGAKEIYTYSLVIKGGTSFVPTLWGLMIDDTSRAFFLLRKIPNNRLHAGVKELKSVHLRRLTKEDVGRRRIISGVASLDRTTWGDRYFDMSTTDSRCTYLLENGEKIVGYLTVHRDGTSFHVDEVVVSKSQQGNDFGGVLIRFADSLARQHSCSEVRLHAIKERVSFYEKFGYKLLDKEEVLQLDKETYFTMRRPVLYHHRLLK